MGRQTARAPRSESDEVDFDLGEVTEVVGLVTLGPHAEPFTKLFTNLVRVSGRTWLAF